MVAMSSGLVAKQTVGGLGIDGDVSSLLLRLPLGQIPLIVSSV